MALRGECLIHGSSTQLILPCLYQKKSHLATNVKTRKTGEIATTIAAKKKDFAEESSIIANSPLNFLAQSAIAVLGLGFIDAGYSGDWSRIGVISKENEDLLKEAAFLVVPLCLFIIFSLSKKPQD